MYVRARIVFVLYRDGRVLCERLRYNEHIIAETTIYVQCELINRHPNGMEHEYTQKYQLNASCSLSLSVADAIYVGVISVAKVPFAKIAVA